MGWVLATKQCSIGAITNPPPGPLPRGGAEPGENNLQQPLLPVLENHAPEYSLSCPPLGFARDKLQRASMVLAVWMPAYAGMTTTMVEHSSKETRRTVTVRIEGRVQGVYYRAWTYETASALGLDGSTVDRPRSLSMLFRISSGGLTEVSRNMVESAGRLGPPGGPTVGAVPGRSLTRKSPLPPPGTSCA